MGEGDLEARDRLILALDVDSESRALRLVEQLRDMVGAFKVGLELVNATGIDILDRLWAAGAKRLFYDCKFHDIPNTVAGAVRAASRHKPWMLNVHAAGGYRMVRAAVEAAHESKSPPLVLGVTLLTSISAEELSEELHVNLAPAYYANRLAKLAQKAGADGVVASPHEIGSIRQTCGQDFVIVTPGVRPKGVDADDQRRVMTPGEAVRRGADYLVIGRAVTADPDPCAAVKRILDEMESEGSA